MTVQLRRTRPTGWRFAGGLGRGDGRRGGWGLWALIPRGWWRVPLVHQAPSYMTLVFLGSTVSTVPIFLVTWRIARPFGWRGRAVTFAVAAVGGPTREFAVEAKFPEWITYTPGIATVRPSARPTSAHSPRVTR